MPGIYIMAAITLALSTLLWGGLVFLLSERSARYLWLLLLGLPLSAAVNLLVKRPLALTVAQMLDVRPTIDGTTPAAFLFFAFMLAPVFEEAIKVMPLLLPQVRAVMTSSNAALIAGLTLGIGFALGEVAYLAYAIAQSPEYAGLPWYYFTGFLSERILVVPMHGVMTALVVLGLHRGKGWILLGYFAAVAVHALLNVGALLLQLGLIPAWATQVLLVVSVAVVLLLFEVVRQRTVRASRSAAQVDEIVYYRREPEVEH